MARAKNQLVIDEILVAKAEFKATGANIHNVKAWISLYVGNAVLYNRHSPKMIREQADIKALYERSEQVLRTFIASGDLPFPD